MTKRILAYAAAGLGILGPAAWADPAQAEFFEKRVRPVLAEHCYGCHGPERQKSGLRVDHISFLKAGGETGPALQPGDAAASRMALAVSYTDVDLQMPPKGKLSDAQIAGIQQWIADGAYWPDEPAPDAEGAAAEPAFDVAALAADHWAWQPIQAVAQPAVSDSAWPRNGIDHFILARLEKAGLTPAGEADRRTLIRRISFDLTGLPPDPEAVEAFVADDRPDAYERLVDRLLASPQYGERWGRHWLDVTRYAETYGHEQDYPVEHAWRYRDYVIRAFNADVPYDQLVTEHIAGDLIENPRINPETGLNESVLATGLWYMHQATHAPVDVRQDQADRIDNQIDVLSKAFLGMTVSCARCHDHKFDAISARDYYALSGFFRSSRQQFAYLDPTGKIAESVDALQRANTDIEAAILEQLDRADAIAAPIVPYMAGAADAHRTGEPVAEAAARMGLAADRLGAWAALLEDEALNDASHPLHLWWKAARAPEADRAFFAAMAQWLNEQPTGAAQADDTVVYETFDGPGFGDWTATGSAFGDGPSRPGSWMEEDGQVELAPAGQAHSGLIESALQGTLRSPDFTIEHDSLHYRVAGHGGEVRLIIEGYELREFNGLLFGSTFKKVDHGSAMQWIDQTEGIGKFKGRRAFIEIVDDGPGWVAVDEIRFGNKPPEPAPDLDTVAALMAPDPPASMLELASRYAALTRDAIGAWNSLDADPGQLALVNVLNRNALVPRPDAAKPFAEALARKDAIAAETPAPVRAIAIAEGTPVDEALMIRGNHKTPGDVIPRRFLEALGGTDQAPIEDGSGRLALARRVMAGDNPLPARVMANRVWHYLMGSGIVPSPDNFGVLGQAPTHPELLDYLATSFRENGWSIKRLIRAIVTSQTYRMDSAPVNVAAEQQDPDNKLLHRMNRRRLEGEAVRDAILAVAGTLDETRFGPSVPAYISPYVEGNRRPKESGPADGDRRRSIYLEVRRNYLPPMLLAFDMPVPDTTQGRRNVSNVPAQALILMNDPFVTDQAAAWAERVIAQAGDTDARLRAVFMDAFSRAPTADELDRMRAFLDSQAAVHAQDGEADPKRVWADLCHVLFTLKEFIFIG